MSISRLLALITLSLLLFQVSAGQDLDQDCRPILLPTECQPIADQIAAIEAEYDQSIRSLQELLQQAAPQQKADLIKRINKLQDLMAKDPALKNLRIQLSNCRQQFDRTPRRQLANDVLNAVFRATILGQVTGGVNVNPISTTIGIQFSRNRCVLTITSFPPIRFRATPLGTAVNVTITKTGGGAGEFHPVSGQIIMPITLLFSYDNPLAAFCGGDDTASMDLTTGNTISQRGTFNLTGAPLTITNNAPVDSCGTTVNGTPIQCPLKLVGTTVFRNGCLGGREGGFTVTGNIVVPSPPPPPPNQTRKQCLAECDQNYLLCMASRENGIPTPAQCASGRTKCKAACPAQ